MSTPTHIGFALAAVAATGAACGDFGREKAPPPRIVGTPGREATGDTRDPNAAAPDGGAPEQPPSQNPSGPAPEVHIAAPPIAPNSCLPQPAQLFAGPIQAGCQSGSRWVTIHNASATPTQVSSVSVVGGSAFAITGVDPPGGFPRILEPGERLAVSVRGIGVLNEPATAALEFQTPGGSCAAVPMASDVTLRPLWTDMFKQFDVPMVDMLVVIDNSASMAPWRRSLRANLTEVAKYVTRTNADVNIGVITTVAVAPDGTVTAPEAPGRLHAAEGQARIVTEDTADADQVLLANLDVGANAPDGNESALEAIRLALSGPLVNDPEGNAGFLRPGAKLSILVISDTDDHTPYELGEYLDWLRNIHGERSREFLSFNAVVGVSMITREPERCGTMGIGTATSGLKYSEIYRATNNGIIESICAPDWAERMTYSPCAFLARLQYPLGRPAAVGTIQVQVNGFEVPHGQRDGWEYDEPLNSIVFGDNAIPPQGATIAITYNEPCPRP